MIFGQLTAIGLWNFAKYLVVTRVGREIPVAGIPSASGNYREILKILAQVGNTGKYDF